MTQTSVKASVKKNF